MKQRKLSLLLVIALIVSMLVPSFALAEDAAKPTVTISNADTYTKELYIDKATWNEKYVYSLTAVGENPTPVKPVLAVADLGDLSKPQLYWTSSDTSVVKVTNDYVSADTLPSLKVTGKAGSATITATKFKATKNGQTQVIALEKYPSFEIKLTELKTKEVKLDENAQAETTFDIELDDKNIHGIDLSGYVGILFDGVPAAQSLAVDADLDWSLTEGSDYAKLWADGVLFPQKAGKAVVTVAAKANAAVKQTFTFNITEGASTTALAEETSIGAFDFTQKEYTINLDHGISRYVEIYREEDEEGNVLESYGYTVNVDLQNEYFLKMDDWSKSWGLRWLSSNPGIAKIDNDGLLTVRGAKAGDQVTITVVAYNDATNSKTATIKFVEDEEKEETALTSIGFVPTALSLYWEDGITPRYDEDRDEEVGGGLWIGGYVDVKPLEARNNVDLVYTLDEEGVKLAWMDGDTLYVRDGVKKGTVKVTVYDKISEKKSGTPLTVTIVDTTDKEVDVTGLKFVPDTLTNLVWEGYDLAQYLKVEPADATIGAWDEAINWVSSDTTILQVNERGYGAWTKKPGTVTVTATEKQSKNSATLTLTFVEAKEEDKIKSLEFVPNAITIDTLYGDFDAWAYLRTEPADAEADIRIASSDTSIAKIVKRHDEDNDWDYDTVEIEKEGTVTLTASVVGNKAITPATLTLTIKKGELAFESLEFVNAPTTAYTTDEIDLSDYLVEKTKYATDYLIWTSSDQQIAQVTTDYYGSWQGEGENDEHHRYVGGQLSFPGKTGSVTITARSALGDKSASVTIEVKEATNPIQTITPVLSSFTMKTDEKDKLLFWRNLTFVPADYQDVVIWTSSNPEVVTVDAMTGEVKMVGISGEATITVRSEMNPKATASFTVTVEKAALKSIAFIADTPKVLNETDNMNGVDLFKYINTDPVDYLYENKADIAFSSSDPQIATVGANGIVEFVKAGKVTITAYYVDDPTIKATTEIERKKVAVTAIKLSKTDVTLKVDEELPIFEYIDIQPANAIADFDLLSFNMRIADTNILGIADEVIGYKGLKKGETKVELQYRNEDDSLVTATMNVKVTDYAVEKIAFAKKTYESTFKYDDRIVTLKFNINPQDAAVEKEDLFVDTSLRTVAKIVDYGVSGNTGWVKVTGVAPGTAKITVGLRDNEKIKSTAKITFKGIAVKRIRLPKKTLRMYFYELNEDNVYQNEYPLESFVQPYNAYCNISWETTDASVCFVNDGGRVDGVPCAKLIATGAGSATITLKVDDGKKVRTQTMKVIVSTKTINLKLNAKKATINMIKGGENTFQLEAFDAKSEEAVAVKWSTSNKKVATVDKNGLVTAKKAGTAVITATTKDGDEVKASCNVTVNKKKVTSIKAKKALTLKVGAEADLTIKVKPADAFNSALKFASSDSSVLYVNKAGHIEAKKAGTAVITVKTTDGSKLSLEITVTVTK